MRNRSDQTTLAAGSSGAITDGAGNRWTITSSNTVAENGNAAGFTANVSEIAFVNGAIWHENTSGQWYSWTGSGWRAGGDPLTDAGSGGGNSAPAKSPSVDGTVVAAGSSNAITDDAGNHWTITSSNAVAENGNAAGFTANVSEIAFVDGVVWHENTAGQWYSWTGSGWRAGGDPLTDAGSGGGGGSDSGASHDSGASAGSPSADGTVAAAGSSGVITDGAGNHWTITSSNTVAENGNAAGFTANVSEIAFVDGVVWHENTSGHWYSWTGSGWQASGNPLPQSAQSDSGSGSAGLSLNDYHLTFDWEANDFPNSPTPRAGRFTTTLSSGLRYLSNGDQQYWSDDSTGQSPFRLHGGVLDINATHTGPGNTPGGGSLSYTSGVLTTQGSFLQQYGYFEMRAQLPQGAGMWPAFWLLDQDSNQPGGWPPELDVLEAFGAPNANGEGGANQAHWGVHSHNEAQQAGGWATLDGNEFTDFHTYGVLWTPETLTFYYDAKEVAQVSTPSDYTHPMYMIANLAVGGTWPGDASGENGTMSIDYIRAFSSDSAMPVVALQPVSSPDGGGMSLYGATAQNSVVPGLSPH